MLNKKIKTTVNKLNKFNYIHISEIFTKKPIEEKELFQIERELDCILPEELFNYYTKENSEIEFRWYDINNPLGEMVGHFHLLHPKKVIEAFNTMKKIHNDVGILEGKFDNNFQLIFNDWCYWIPIISFDNDDYFCLDIRTHEIVFCDHSVFDGVTALHGVKVANSFSSLIKKWGEVRFIDFYWWNKVVDKNGLSKSMVIENSSQEVKNILKE